MKIACLLITHLPLKAEIKRYAELRGRPVIITAESSQGSAVLDASPKAKGVVPGMPLQEAMSRCKAATLIEGDEAYYLAVFERIIQSLVQRNPLVERSGLGCAYVGDQRQLTLPVATTSFAGQLR